MKICPLADVAEAIPLLARWFNNEWQAFDGRSTSVIEDQLAQNVNRDSVPITFVALDDSTILGTISLDHSDLPSHDHLSPWLASLYVRPTARGAGIGSALVRHLQKFAVSRGCGPLYLWTPGATRLYERCGWTIIHRTTYNSQPITIMCFTNGSETPEKLQAIAGCSRAPDRP